MPPTNWPPAIMPQWPDNYASVWRALAQFMRDSGWTIVLPTGGERHKYFEGVLDGDDHPVRGIMVVSNTGVRYPFAVCTDLAHLELLVPWFPYIMGTLSGVDA